MSRSSRSNKGKSPTTSKSPKSPQATTGNMEPSSEIMEMMKTQMDELKTSLLKTVRDEIKSAMTSMTKEISDITSSLNEAYRRIEDLKADKCKLEQKVSELTEEINELKQKDQSMTSRLEKLEERQIASDSYSKRDNLLIYGIPQKDNEVCLAEVRQFMIQHLKIARVIVEPMKIQRCHRLNINMTPQPIICRFHFFPDRMTVWNNRKKLQGTPFSMSEDFPPEIVSRRRILYPIFRAARNITNKCRLIGDKLELDGKVYTVRNLHTLPVKYDPAQLATTEKNGITAFFTRHSPLSNFNTCEIVIDDVKYTCVEQFFQEQRAIFGNKPEIAAKIHTTNDPAKCKYLGESVSVKADDWLPVAVQTMRKACWEKFSKSVRHKEFLLKTKDTLIAEASHDKIWGIGRTLNDPKAHVSEDFQRQNRLGQILMDIRKELIPK